MRTFVVLFSAFMMLTVTSKAEVMKHSEVENLIRKEIKTNGEDLLKSDPKDVELYCPKYSSFTKPMKLDFWAKLMSELAQTESKNNASASYHEAFGDNLKSYYGLLRIPPKVAKKNDCSTTSTDGLKDPERNVSCGVQVMKNRILSSNEISKNHIKDLWPSLNSKSARGKVFQKKALKAVKSDCGLIWARHQKKLDRERLPASKNK
jgi:hypothetical protein